MGPGALDMRIKRAIYAVCEILSGNMAVTDYIQNLINELYE